MKLLDLKVYQEGLTEEESVELQFVIKLLKGYACLVTLIGNWSILIVEDPLKGYQIILRGDGLDQLTIAKKLKQDSYIIKDRFSPYEGPFTLIELTGYIIDKLTY